MRIFNCYLIIIFYICIRKLNVSLLNNKIMKTKIVSLLLCVGLLFACNNTQKGAGVGAGGGAVLGGIIGAIAGNTAVGAVVGGAVGAGVGAVIGNRMDKAKAEAAKVQNAKVETVKDANGLDAVKVSFDSGILFATGKSDLNATSQNSIKQIADVLKKNSDMDVAIYGHTDSTGSDAINNPLSKKRAQAVQKSLVNQGVSNIKVVDGQGSKNPVADNSTEAGRQQNRRVEVYMYASQQMIQAAQSQAN